MSDQLVPAASGLPAYPDGSVQLQPWQDQQAAPTLARSPIERPMAAVRRYKWLIIAVILLASAGGVVALRFVPAKYAVQTSIMIAGDSPMSASAGGPIRSAGLLANDDWVQLLKSFRIADAVVQKLSLYITPDNRIDAPLFAGFQLAENGAYIPGKYELDIDQTHKRWTLTLQNANAPPETGAATDSVGRKAGFKWLPPKWVFNSKGVRKVKFTVSTPREEAVKLTNRLVATRREGSDFLLLTLTDPDPKLAAAILNTWAAEYVDVAAQLKKRKLTDFATTLAGQLQTAKASLEGAEEQLSRFRVTTITQPSEGTQGPIAAGIQQTTDPVIRSYFDKKIEYDNLKNDVKSLQGMLGSLAKDSLPSDALLMIPSVAQGGAAAQSLRDAFSQYHKEEADLAADRTMFTDEHPVVKNLIASMTSLRKEKIPEYANELLISLRAREVDDSLRIAGAGQNLQQIPQRTIDEERLRRIHDINGTLYTNLQNRYSEAQLAEASATPDLTILDSAIAPLSPTTDTAIRVVAMAVAGGIGAAFVLALLLDRLDSRLRYAEQVTDELGLVVAGTVPLFPKGGVDQNSPEQMFQLVESFRELRMSVMQATGPRVSLAISSPSPGEGKSLIAANLAMSFAEAGLRTVLVDGDTRRGTLHEMFGLASSPGLTDCLSGKVGWSQVIYPSSHEKLVVIPFGTRLRRSPELLTSRKLEEFVTDLRAAFDVVIFDTPPLTAGVDGYSVASRAGSMLIVLRVGETRRRLAWEKLRMFERLPVNLIGAVLNGISVQEGYSYYGYVPGYEAVDEPAAPGTAVVEVG